MADLRKQHVKMHRRDKNSLCNCYSKAAEAKIDQSCVNWQKDGL